MNFRSIRISVTLFAAFFASAALTSCVLATEQGEQLPSQLADIRYGDVDFGFPRASFLQTYRGAIQVPNADDTLGVSHYALQGDKVGADVIGVVYFGDDLMNLLFTYQQDRIAELGGVKALQANAIKRFGPPTAESQLGTIWSFPDADRKIVANSQPGMWTLYVERPSLTERLSAAKKLASRPKSEANPPSVVTDPPKSGWVYWQPTAAERAELEQESRSYSNRRGRAAPAFRVAESQDLSFAGRSRFSLKIRVDGPLTTQQIEAICRSVLAANGRYQAADAVMFFFYLPQTDLRNHYTAGKATWGEWTSSGGRNKSLAISPGNAIGDRMDFQRSGLAESKKRRIFYELVVAQDAGVGDDRSYEVVANRYGLSEDEVRKIGLEGSIQGWPMP